MPTYNIHILCYKFEKHRLVKFQTVVRSWIWLVMFQTIVRGGSLDRSEPNLWQPASQDFFISANAADVLAPHPSPDWKSANLLRLRDGEQDLDLRDLVEPCK